MKQEETTEITNAIYRTIEDMSQSDIIDMVASAIMYGHKKGITSYINEDNKLQHAKDFILDKW